MFLYIFHLPPYPADFILFDLITAGGG